jgi:hypothetical protein
VNPASKNDIQTDYVESSMLDFHADRPAYISLATNFEFREGITALGDIYWNPSPEWHGKFARVALAPCRSDLFSAWIAG